MNVTLSISSPPTMPPISRQWLEIFDLLATVPLVAVSDNLGVCGTSSTSKRVKAGGVSSLSYSGFFTLPEGFLKYDYSYKSEVVARLTINGFLSFPSSFSRIDIKIDDPNFIFLLYREQRLARFERGVCELCGTALSKKEIKNRRWRHANCTTYDPYTESEESQVSATSSLPLGTDQIGANAPSSRSASNVVNQNTSESLISSISRRFFNRR